MVVRSATMSVGVVFYSLTTLHQVVSHNQSPVARHAQFRKDGGVVKLKWLEPRNGRSNRSHLTHPSVVDVVLVLELGAVVACQPMVEEDVMHHSVVSTCFCNVVTSLEPSFSRW